MNIKQKILYSALMFFLVISGSIFITIPPANAASADVQCKNIKDKSDKKACEDYVKSYNLCDDKKTEDAKKTCKNKAYNDYLNAVCGTGSDNATVKCRENGLGTRFIADIRNGGGNFCPSQGEVKDGCVCQSGEVQKNVSTVGQPPKLMCVRESNDGGDGTDATGASNIYPTSKDYGLKDNPIIIWINRAINFIAGLVGIGAVIMIIFAGIQYITARDNPQSVQAAKTKIINVIIGLVAFALLFAFMQWLIPGGIF